MSLSSTVFGLSAPATAAVARQMDASGFDVLWLPDHVATPLAFDPVYPYDTSGRPGYAPTTPLVDVWAMIGYLAAVTPRLSFGTGVYILPLRRPLVVAQAVRTVLDIAPGRLELGLGVGWMREEFLAVGEQFERRGDRFDEMLDIMAAAWTGEPFQHHGDFYDIDPIQQGGGAVGPVPLVFGGTAERALRRTAQRGDGWFGPPACPLDEAIAYRARLEDLRARHGRDHLPFRYYVRVADPSPASFDRYREAGFEDLVVSLPRTAAGTLDQSEVGYFLDRTVAIVRSS